MKKIITILSLFTGIISNAQYIEPTRFEVEANFGYGFTVNIKDESNAQFARKGDFKSKYNGLISEVSAHYRLGFDSSFLIGLRMDYVKGSRNAFTNFNSENKFDITKEQGSMLFVGPSFRKEVVNSTGVFFSTVSLSPGAVFLTNEFTGAETGTISSTGIGINLSTSAGYVIYKDLMFTTNFGLDFSYFSKYNYDFPSNTALNSNEDSSSFLRAKLAVGLRYKL